MAQKTSTIFFYNDLWKPNLLSHLFRASIAICTVASRPTYQHNYTTVKWGNDFWMGTQYADIGWTGEWWGKRKATWSRSSQHESSKKDTSQSSTKNLSNTRRRAKEPQDSTKARTKATKNGNQDTTKMQWQWCLHRWKQDTRNKWRV